MLIQKRTMTMNKSQYSGQVPWLWWLKVIFHSLLLLSGQAATTLLSRLYFENGGSSRWLHSFTLTAAFPLLLLHRRPSPSPAPPVKVLFITFSVLGLLSAANTILFSYSILHLPVSTFCLISAAQLGFNAVFSIFINHNRLRQHAINTIVLLAFSTFILALHDGVGGGGAAIPAIFSTLGACATYSLMLSLTELAFEKVVGGRTMATVLQNIVYTAAVATAVGVAGLVGSGEWKEVRVEMEGFEKGRVTYVMTLVMIGVGRQVSSVGLVGLVSQASSLFSNVMGTLSVPMMPLLALVFFDEKVDGMKVVSFLMAMWALATYFYQQYGEERRDQMEISDCFRKEVAMDSV